VGALENLHVQGYLRYWDELVRRNPGLWIDSCASGGRRNELETMRRAVPLHYTDVGYGEHPIKQKQHRFMFEWIPYFRAHNMNWCDAEGAYGNGTFPADRYSYHCALTPSLTDMTDRNAPDEAMSLAREMTAIWRCAAELMLRGDYYPLTECRKSAEDYYAMQFEDRARGDGFVQVVRNSQCIADSFTARLQADGDSVYRFVNPETGERFERDGKELKEGLTVRIPRRSGVVWFYTRHAKV
jgi:alpha-galactosidase